jgi:hypothetical protein
MSITDTQTAAPKTAIDPRVAELEDRVLELLGEIARVKQDRDAAEAAGVEMASAIADGIRREEELEARATQAEQEADGLLRANFGLQDALDDLRTRFDVEHLAHRRACDEVIRLVAAELELRAENSSFRTELANLPTRLLRRRPRPQDH